MPHLEKFLKKSKNITNNFLFFVQYAKIFLDKTRNVWYNAFVIKKHIVWAAAFKERNENFTAERLYGEMPNT